MAGGGAVTRIPTYIKWFFYANIIMITKRGRERYPRDYVYSFMKISSTVAA